MSRIGCWGSLVGIAIALGNTFNAHCALAQITPDGTLPNNSIVTPSGNTINITGGTQAGNNLFHSFQEFSIRTGNGAFFDNALNIQNIISRVTGGSISNIDGFIQAKGAANVFLLNPNGIIFGPNASLNVGGSFVATTANAIQFGNIGFFSADNPNAPTPLLTINPSALLFNQLPTAIINRSQAAAGTNPAGVEVTGLKVPEGKSLLLGGGNINVEGGALRAYGGRVELAGLAAPGVVGLNVADNTLSFSVPNEIARADISLTNAAEINVRGADGGSIAINAQNLSLAGESKLRAGIDTGLGTPQSKAGDIDINATGATTLTDGSFIANVLQATSVGKGGNINITTGSLGLINGSNLNTSNLGQGDGGNINITTGSLGLINGSNLNTSNLGQGDGGNINLNIRDALTLAGVDQNGIGSAIVSSVRSQAVGKGGSLNIQAGSVSLADGAYVDVSTFGKGDAGNVSILARDTVSLSFAYIYSNVEAGGVGNGGNINITASSLSLKDGAQLQTTLRDADTQNNLPGGRGNAGNINIDVRSAVTLAGVKDGVNSGIFSSVGTGAEGNGGSINIKSGTFSLTDGARLNASTLGKGNAGSIFIQASDSVSLDNSGIKSDVDTGAEGNGGSININAGSVTVQNGAELSTTVSGKGNGGNIIINARDRISFDGKGEEIFSRANTSVRQGGEGKAGDIQVTTGTLSLNNGAFFSSSTLGKGDAGNITIDASDRISFDGNSYASSTVGTQAVGKGGDIRVTTGSLSLTNGAQLNTNVSGQGDAGNITVDASGTITFNGGNSGIKSDVNTAAEGKGGSININAGSLTVQNGAELSTTVSGKGNGGNIILNARDRISFDGKGEEIFSRANTSVQQGGEGKAGDIQVTTGTLSLNNGAFFSSSTLGKGDAGNITIDASDTITFNGGSSAQSSVYDSGVGKGGDIRVRTGSLSLTNGAQLNTNVSGQGDAGNITVDARDTVNLDGVVGDEISGIYSSLLSGVGKGGDIRVTTGSLSVTNGAQLSSSTDGRGNAGNITVDARDTVTFEGIGKDKLFGSSARTTLGSNGVGNGGNIRVNARALFLKNGGQLNADSFGQGNAGSITIDTRDTVAFDGVASNGNYSAAQTSGRQGNGGDIRVTTGTLSLTNGGLLFTSARGNSGNITINARDAVNFDGVGSNGSSSGAVSLSLPGGVAGKGGDIQVTTGSLSVTNGAQLLSSTAARGNGGNITIDARDTVKFDGTGSNQASSGAYSTVESDGVGNAGNIKLTTGSLSLNNGGQLSAATAGQGNAGDITIDARDAVTFNGTGSNGRFSGVYSTVESGGVGKGGNIQLKSGTFSLSNNALINAATSGRGDAGNISVTVNDAVSRRNSDPRRITIRDGAKISVNSDGTGNAGNITLRAGNLTLDNKASISAQTATSQGGNINLNLGEVLLLRRGSQISATAGTAGAGGDGGNITIDAPGGFIVAVPNENSDITANAFSGQGGNVTIRSAGIFNIAPLSRQDLERLSPNDLNPNNLPTNDITAISQQNPTLGGQVSLNTPDADQSLGLVELPTVLAGTSELIAESSCAAVASTDSDTGKSRFTFTGRGGLPPSPYEPLSTDVVWLDTRLSAIASQQQRSEKPAGLPPSKAETVKIVPATGWVFDGKGHVTLISHTSGNSSLGSTPAGCPKQ